MAFKDRVEAITKLTIDTGQPVTQNQLDELLTEGRREVTNAMPMSIKMSRHGHTVSSFTSTAVGSESANHEGGEVLWVTRNDGTIDQPCRKISRRLAARATDSSEMFAATVNDPVWYTNGNQVNALPASGTCKYAVLQFNTVQQSDSAIIEFPDEYEYLVVLYASIKSLQAALADKSGNTDITTALTAMKAAIEAAEASLDKMESTQESVFGDETTFLTAHSQLTRVKDAVDKVSDIVNGNQPSSTTDAFGAQANEDIELVTSALNIAQTELSRAQMHLSEWTSIGDMRVKQINASLSEAQGYATEIQTRLAVDSTEYSWMEKQQAKLQADYEKGIQIMRGDYKS